MTHTPRSIEEAVRFAVQDHERVKREAAEAREREETAYRRLVYWIACAEKGRATP